MDDEQTRAILEQVKSGDLSPEDAARLLAATPPNPGADAPPAAGPADLRWVRVRSTANRVVVVGDPSVHEVEVTGAHDVVRDGDTLVIEGESLEHREWSFGAGSGPRRVRVGGLGDLTVRVNPSLGLHLQVDAGKATATGMKGPLKAEVNAGKADIDGFHGPVTLRVAAGSLKASGVVVDGDSTIHCDAGNVVLHVLDGSGVRFTKSVTLGNADIPGPVGDGSSTLAVVCNLGSVKVRSGAGAFGVAVR